MRRVLAVLGVVAVVLVACIPWPEPQGSGPSAGKPGGIVRFVHREDLRTDRFAHHPHVKNLVPHQVVYNCCRLQDVWVEQ
jgi:hypothetical protein